MTTKDWTANSRSTFATLGASNHSENEREQRDFYATPPEAVERLLEVETFSYAIWEPACGLGHISNVLRAHGYMVADSDIVSRNGNIQFDFLSSREPKIYALITDKCPDIITNPPYAKAQEFVEQALRLVRDGGKVAMLLRIQFLEGVRRRKLFDTQPPRTVYVFSKRIQCAMNGDFEKYKSVGSAQAYARFVWEKGYTGDTIIKWIN